MVNLIADEAVVPERIQDQARPLTLAAELGRFLRGEPIQARQLSSAGRLLRWIERHPTISLLCGALAVTLMALAVMTGLYLRARG